jgi:type IV pilus assembly protein PilB
VKSDIIRYITIRGDTMMTVETTKERLGDKLVSKNLINEKQLKECLKAQKTTGKKLGEILIQKNLITQEDLANVLKEHLNLERITLTPSNIDNYAAKLVPENICKRYLIIPFKIENNKLYLAMHDPQNREAIQDVRRISNMEVVTFISTIDEINQALGFVYASSKIDKVVDEYSHSNKPNIKEIVQEETDVNSAPIVKLVNNILENAIRNRASDIHIEPEEKYMRIRFRIDGILTEYMKTSIEPHQAVVSRIKIMSGLNISEKRLPQDGRIFLSIDNRPIDFRVSTMPTSKSEKVVMRVLDKSNFLVSKEKLGLSQYNIEKYNNLISKPYGLILVTGPTGSGKTTTLYSMLNQLNDKAKNIVTIEDPVEYELEGINQTQINNKAGLTFASGLRSFLRQDPDIIMVGEIRDSETAEIAVRASLTGHSVLSTLHANNAAGAIARLVDMDIDKFSITSSLVGVIAQRLVRQICPHCREEYIAQEREKRILGYDKSEELILFRGKGCERCNNSGYNGRIGVYEIIEITNPIRDIIDNNGSEENIFKKARELGMETMKEDATNKVIQGITTIEEMMRVTFIND